MNDNLDCTILILYRGDSLQRLKNLLGVINFLVSFPSFRIYVREANDVKSVILYKLLPTEICYEFVYDEDPILHKTRHFNEMIQGVNSKYIGIWDTDTIPYAHSVSECITKLTSDSVSLALPYNGICLDTSANIASLYLENNDFKILDQARHLMKKLQPHRLTGGAVLMNLEAFVSIGAENEKYYGWGDDDFDRYIRFMNAGMKIFRSNTPLFHLSHPRGLNSCFDTPIFAEQSKLELSKTINRDA